MKNRILLCCIVILLSFSLSGCTLIEALTGKTGANGTIFYVEYADSRTNEPRMLKKCDLSTRQIVNVCPADFYLIEGFTETEGVRAARENVEKGETEILTVYGDGSIRSDCIIKDPRLLHVLAAHGNDYYYCRLTENKEYCCEYIRLNQNGETFIYPYAENQMCFCPPQSAIQNGAISPADNERWTYPHSNTVSPGGRIAFSFYESIFDETKDSFAFPYAITPDQIVIIDSDGSVRNIGEGGYPVWLNDDTLLFVSEEDILCKYSMKDGTTEAYKTKSGETISIYPKEYETQMSVSKDGKQLICMLSRSLGGASPVAFSLDTGEKVWFKKIATGAIVGGGRAFFGN